MQFFTTKSLLKYFPLLLSVFILLTPIPTLAAFSLNGFVYGFFITLGGIITWIGGTTLDIVIEYFVIRMGAQLNGPIGVAVDSLWVIVRDIFNLLFIFSLVYIGLRTILFTTDSNTKKTLGLLIIAALLINFSLFATKTIVDFSNIAAHQIYKQIVVIPPSNEGSAVDIANLGLANSGTQVSISGAFMQHLKLASYADASALQNLRDSSSTILGLDTGISFRFMMFGFIMMLFMILVGAIFFGGAILLAQRFVVLLLFMIASPLMLAGLIFPGLESYMKRWWKMFIANALIAPAYLFMLYISLRIIQEMSGVTKNTKFAELFDANASGATLALLGFFLVMAGFMAASLLIAKKMGAVGADTSISVAKGVGRMTAGRLASGAIGGGSNRLLNRFNKMDANDGIAARTIRTLGFDKDIVKTLEKGKSSKLGAFTSRDERTDWTSKRGAEMARSRALTKYKKDLTGTPAEVQQALADMNDSQLVDIAKTSDGREALKTNAQYLSSSQIAAIAKSDEINDAQTSEVAGARSTAIKGEIGTDAGKIRSASAEKLAALGVSDTGSLTDKAVAVHLDDDKIKDLKMIDAHKDSVKKARKDAYKEIIHDGVSVGGKTVTDVVNMSSSDTAKLPDDIFKTTGLGATEKSRVEAFVQQLPFTTLAEISRKKGKEVQQDMRRSLESIASGGAAPGSRERELHEWLSTDRIGRTFGV